MHFSPKIRHIPLPCDVNIAISKVGESKWRNLVNLGWLWQCNFRMFFNCCYFCVRVRPKNFLSLCLFLFSLLSLACRLSLDSLLNEQKMLAFSFCILEENDSDVVNHGCLVIWIIKTLFVEHSRQVKVFVSRIFGIIAKDANNLLASLAIIPNWTGHSLSVCDQSFIMKHRVFCCTRSRTGSRDSHTCVASYTNHFWNICGNLKIALGVNLFVSKGETRLKHVPSLLERGLIMNFSPRIRHILPPCDNCDIKDGGKRLKKFGQTWLTLIVQLFWYVY